MSQICTVADFCEALGAPRSCVPELIETLQARETFELAQHEARMLSCAGRPDNVALPLRDDGDDWGYVEARIPKTLLFNVATRLGWDAVTDDGVMKDLLRDNPQCRVKTVSGRTQVGWTPGRKVLKRYN